MKIFIDKYWFGNSIINLYITVIEGTSLAMSCCVLILTENALPSFLKL